MEVINEVINGIYFSTLAFCGVYIFYLQLVKGGKSKNEIDVLKGQVKKKDEAISKLKNDIANLVAKHANYKRNGAWDYEIKGCDIKSVKTTIPDKECSDEITFKPYRNYSLTLKDVVSRATRIVKLINDYQKAIDSENYELASELHKEIKNLKDEDSTHND